MFIEAEPGSETGRETRFGRANRHKRRPAHSGGTASPPADLEPTPVAAPTEAPAPEVTTAVVVEAPAPAPTYAPSTATPDDIAALRAELAAERRSRAWLEGRLEELDQRLRRAQASERASQNAAAHDQVAVLGFQASLTAESVREADREALGLWVLEAQLHADAAESLQAIAYRSEPIHVIAEPVADARLNEKLATARIAIEAAEARSAHNAAQVRRLTEELASARVEQTRTMNRLRDLEKKLMGLEVRADLLDSIVTDRNPPAGTRDLDLPADSIASLSPERPSLVFTETEDGPQLAAPEAPTLEDTSTGLSLEDFEPTPYPSPAKSPVEDLSVETVPSTFEELFGTPEPAVSAPVAAPEAPDNDLVGALSEFFGSDSIAPKSTPAPDEAKSPSIAGIASLDDEPVSGPPREMQHDDPLAEALALWGQGVSVPMDVPGVTDTIESVPDTRSDDPFDGLDDALSALERPAAERLAATVDAQPEQPDTSFLDDSPGTLDLDDDPYRDLAAAFDTRPVAVEPEAIEELVEEPASIQEVVEDEPDTVVPEPAPAPPRPGGILAARGESISTSLFDAVHRVERERREAAAAPRPHLADLQRNHAAETDDDGSGTTDTDAKPDKKGRANMVDALMRFMGPQ